MGDVIQEAIERAGIDLKTHEYVSHTCDNIKVRCLKTNKIIDIRW